MKKKWLAVFLTAAMVAGLMACGKQKPAVTENKENPKVTETNTESNSGESNNTETAPLEFACQVRDGDYNPADVQMYKELEEKTKVKINWTTYSASAWQEKKSLLFASNELPDAFFGQWVLSSDEVVKYGTEGILIPLEDYITEENTPNLYKIFQEYPEYKSSVTAPDGHIYSLMAFDDGYITTTDNPLYINKDWLEKVNMQVPTTTEEFHNVLKAFKEQDANGNGDPDDEIPYSFHKGINYASDLFGSFGIIDKVSEHLGVKDGRVFYTAAEEPYKEAIQYFNGLFQEGLIDQEAFTQDSTVFSAKLKSEPRTVGVFQAWRSTAWALEDGDDSYIAMGPLAGPDGTKLWPERANGIQDMGSFSITKIAKDPEYIMNWVDNCYEPLFSVQASLALKVGLHLKDTGNGTYETVLAPTDENKEGVIPGVNTRIFNVSEEAAALLKDCPAHLIEKKELDNYYNDYYYPEYYPQFLFSAEENDKLATLKTEINNYANEKYATWMMNGGIEKEWDSYLKQLDNMGLQEMLAIYQTALDRYKSNLK